jgi:hypothetical protein
MGGQRIFMKCCLTAHDFSNVCEARLGAQAGHKGWAAKSCLTTLFSNFDCLYLHQNRSYEQTSKHRSASFWPEKGFWISFGCHRYFFNDPPGTPSQMYSKSEQVKHFPPTNSICKYKHQSKEKAQRSSVKKPKSLLIKPESQLNEKYGHL